MAKLLSILKRARSAWAGAHARCYDPRHPQFYRYGGQGITVSPEWSSYQQFLLDMGHPAGASYVLDRIDGNKGYSKENCRWVTPTQSCYNRKLPKKGPGPSGVRCRLDGRRWEARSSAGGALRILYYGEDFFEACCARKSWEARTFL